LKIISPFHDYYDSAMVYFDDTILLKRKTERRFLGEVKVALPYHMDSIAISYGRGISSNHRIAAIDYLYFCGKVYPLFVLFNARRHWERVQGKYTHIEQRSDQVYFNSIDDLLKACEQEGLKINRSFGQPKNHIEKIKERLKRMENQEISADVFRSVGAPYFILEGNVVVVYPELKAITKSFKMDAATVYQEIEMYMGGVLGQEEKPVEPVSDIDKRNSKGFDEYSFKKRKEE